MIRKIVTHPGGAHKDDFLAVCVLISKYSAPVERRVVEPEDLADKATCVVDIGGSDDSELHNFDHHQYPREHEPTCALSLVLKFLGLYDDAKLFCDWLDTAEWFDSRGPQKTAEYLGVSRDAVARLNSPIDITMLRRFAKVTQLGPGQPLYEVMRYIGDDLIEHVEGARRRLDQTAASLQVWPLDGVFDGAQAVFMERSENPPEEPSSSLARYVRAQQLESKVVALIYPDRRGEGYGMSRFDDHPGLDFCRVAEQPDVHFAHVSGFMCKTTATDPLRLRELLHLSWKAPLHASSQTGSL